MGILIYVAFYEMGMGGSFFILAQDIFLPRHRTLGCGVANSLQFLFGIAVNFGYPVLSTALSGGPSGDQDVGQAWTFVIFGGFGVFCVVFLSNLMPKTQTEERNAAAGVLGDDDDLLIQATDDESVNEARCS